MQKTEIKKLILKATEGVASTLTDLLLVELFLGLRIMASGGNYKSIFKASYAADQDLQKINYQTIKNVIKKLKRKGLIKYIKSEKVINPQITKKGEEKLKEILPTYYKKRVWDKKWYLVTYDIPEKRRKERDLIRYYLKKLGCGKLQASVWITPYNPKELLYPIIKERYLGSFVIISDTGEDGTIGEESSKELAQRVWKLNKINNQYQTFLVKYSNKKASKTEMAFHFWSILENDPQLPFELLPEDWRGEKAYNLFKKLTTQNRIEDSKI